MTTFFVQDTLTVIRKELKELIALSGFRRVIFRILFFIAFMGIVLPLKWGENWLNSYIIIYYWSWLSCFLIIGPAANSIIKERFYGCFEVLLSSRLQDNSIYIGKILSSMIYSFSILLISIVLGLITLNIVSEKDIFQNYSLLALVFGLTISILTMFIWGAISFMVSLRIKNPLRILQIINLFILILIIPGVYIDFFSHSSTQKEFENMIQNMTNNYWYIPAFIVVILSFLATYLLSRIKKIFNRKCILE